MAYRSWFRPAVFVLAVFACMALGGQARAGELIKMADGVYSYAGSEDDSPKASFGANAGIVIGEEAILVVDTRVSAKAAGRFINDIRRVSDKPIRYAVNTHCHLDHAYGNSEFMDLGALIISQVDCRGYMKNANVEDVSVFGLTDEDMKWTRIALPTITFTERLRVDLGGTEVELIYPAPSHSPGSIMVYVPDAKVLFTGDILFTGFHPFLGEGDLEGWQQALDTAKALEARLIIPGHGPVSNQNDLEDMKEYLKVFDAKARELAAESDDADYIATEILNHIPKRPLGKGLIKWNIQMKYMAPGK